jgi:glutamine amidotransferase
MTRIAILDYGMGNLRSVEKALERVGAEGEITAERERAEAADGIILPGVGAFPRAMERVRQGGLDELVAGRVSAGVPVLGICLGMQLLFAESEESPGAAGIGLLPGAVRRLRTDRKLPHIGWSRVEWSPSAPLAPEDGSPGASTYYFVHSFGCEPEDEALVMGRARHGVEFCAAAGRPGVLGVQFHPEKSSAAGLGLLGRWLAGVRAAGAPHLAAP